MLNIDDEPNRPICSIHGPLKWGYFTATKQGPRWVSWTLETVDGLGAVLVPHVCDSPDQPPARWQPDPVNAERAHRGAELARRALAGDNPFTDEDGTEEQHDG